MSSVFVPFKSSSAVFVTISSKSVSICNRFHAKLVDSPESTHFEEISKFDASCGLIKLKELELALLRSTFNARNFIRKFSLLSPAISTPFSFKIGIEAENRKNY